MEQHEEELTPYNEAIKQARASFDKASKSHPQKEDNGNGAWSTPGFGKHISPDLVSDEFLDTEIIILLQGTNLFGSPVYSYLQLIGSNLKAMFAKMQAGENFKPAEFGTVIAAGKGKPSQELRDEMKEKYNMIDIDTPTPPSPKVIQPKFFGDENKEE